MSKYAKRDPKDAVCCPNFQWRFCLFLWWDMNYLSSISSITLIWLLIRGSGTAQGRIFQLPPHGKSSEFLKWRYVTKCQSYEIKSPPWTILWFRILEIFSIKNVKRLCVFMFQTWDNSQLLRRVWWISADYCLKFETQTHNIFIFSTG